MNEAKLDPFASHGGILLPLDMFRVTMLAAVLGETLVGKARNILDAQLVLTRHPQSQLLLGRIQGSVIGDDAAGFWRENADLVLAVSQVLPRQAFLYYVHPGPGNERRQGFVVAQRGQVIAADDASTDTFPAGTPDTEWPVAKLCEQMRLTIEELASGFQGGPQISVSLVEPNIDDQAALMTLAGGPMAAGDDVNGGQPGAPPGAGEPPRADEAMADFKRRAMEQAEEQASLQERARAIASGLDYARDECGLVVAPNAALSEPDLLREFVVARLEGDVPPGVPGSLAGELQGSRIDMVVPVEFLSEVFVDNKPLSRPAFEGAAREVTVAGRPAQALEVLAPRIGYGTLIARGRNYVFVSRRGDLPIPDEIVEKLLAPG